MSPKRELPIKKKTAAKEVFWLEWKKKRKRFICYQTGTPREIIKQLRMQNVMPKSVYTGHKPCYYASAYAYVACVKEA